MGIHHLLPPSANESETPLQDFYCLTATNHALLCSNYQDGLLLNNESNAYEQIDEVVKQYSSATYSLISIDKLVPTTELHSGNYHHFVRQFGGEGSPDVDSSFDAIEDIPGLQVMYKMADSRDYITFPPLSVGFFQSS